MAYLSVTYLYWCIRNYAYGNAHVEVAALKFAAIYIAACECVMQPRGLPVLRVGPTRTTPLCVRLARSFLSFDPSILLYNNIYRLGFHNSKKGVDQ